MTVAELAPVAAWPAFLWAARTTWRELVGVIVVSVGWAVAGVPLVVALAGGQPVVIALGSLPLAIATTGLFGSLGLAAAGGPVRVPRSGAFDLTLGLACWVWLVSVVVALGLGALGLVVASILGALGALVLPLALSYGAVRGRHGIGALRGGLLIAVVRPGLALALAGLAFLAAFACVATAGSLVVVAPALVALTGCRTVHALLGGA